MTQMDPRRVAAALAVAAALVAANPATAAADEPDATPRLTVGGQPLAKLLRTEPGAPFIAFEASKVRPVPQGGSNCFGGSLGYYPYPGYAALAGLGIGAAIEALSGK